MITTQDIERHLEAHGFTVVVTYRATSVWRRRGGGADAAIEEGLCRQA